MLRIKKLTERDLTRIVKRVINEQFFFGNAGGLLGMPETGVDAVNVGVKGDGMMGGECQTYKSSAEMTLELFGKLKGISGQPNQLGITIDTWILRLHNSMTGVGASNDLTKVLSEIKTQQQMGSVLNSYNKKFGRTLYQDLSGEYTISWDTIWGIVKKFKSGISIDGCKKYQTQSA